ncbi:SDR family oxidoreductase [Antarcticibacterium flavum]|uniref:SDR family oxidoreductase n=1 Tax=Antarcticibacterium flavum TaxID=2058175 RepID=A0A5B7X1Z8_9FLAO|nr:MULTISPECIES: SDR family oxidoreductase [Antarcticibacterium]MCM4161453.1 NAD(P)-dependent oxidoreductase [Antarcticibacterium sp. W02-3]QCY69310.1 SDR family oxidoreductase [Antarcticibacterium flavum]
MNISILGCGWLGLPLAKKLVEQGHVVKGSTTTREKMDTLTAEGITPYQIKLYEDGVQGDLTAFLSDADLLIIDIPPGLRKDPDADFTARIGRLKAYIEKSGVEKVIFVSSTSVYEDREDLPEYTENDLPNASGNNSQQLMAAENILRNSEEFTTSIIRFGGLIGPGRHPVNFLAGREGIKDPQAPVNLIHQEDCIGILIALIENEIWGEILNAAYPEHPSKESYYSRVSREKNLAIPEFDQTTPSKGKIISSVVLKEKLGYEFGKGIY